MAAEAMEDQGSAVREFRAGGDAEDAARILREAKGATAWSAEDLSRMGELSGVSAYVSAGHIEITGIVIGRRVADEAEVLNLAVRQENRGKGEGRALLERLLKEYKGVGVSRVFLEVRESNEGAIGFYQHWGFRVIGRRKDYYQGPAESALVMELSLGKSTE
jgi:[ribosomal protein S18]-alanine N-acetyltransferase